MSRIDLYAENPSIEIITGACPHDCPDTCSWQVAVERGSGRAVDIWGHAGQPVTGGRLCGKVDRYLERTYHPARLTTPLRRVGPKGGGHFEAITWEEAIGEIARRLTGIIDEHGPEAVLPYSYAGTMGLLQGEGMASRFWHKMGASNLARTICSEAGFEGYLYTIGAAEGIDTPDFAHAGLILLWGTNTLTSNLHLWPYVQAARKAGARVIAIDPARTRTAQASDEWIPIRPGTDAALALAMMHVIIRDGLHDAEYVARYTLGFDALAERVAEWTPSRAEAVTGIPAARIEALAREYAGINAPAIRVNYGLQRHKGGGMAMRAITCLPALVGAWRQPGGGVQLSASGGFRHMDKRSLYRPDLLAGRTPRTLNMVRLGDALSLDPARIAQSHYAPRPVDAKPAPEQAGPPVKALVVYNSNPAAVAPDQSAVIAGLAREDLFTVVLEHFQTDTADYADILLPATTQLEHWDIVRPYGHFYLPLNRPAIAPVGQSLPNSEIFRRLAQAMGYTDPCFGEDDETILRTLIQAQEHPTFATVTWERLLADGFARLNLPEPYLPFAQGGFSTPSGKCEFYSERMAQDGYDPLPDYTPPGWQQEEPEPTGALVCISPPAHSFLNSSFANLERFRGREKNPAVILHPADAAARNIHDGDTVRLHNQLGAVEVQARISGKAGNGSQSGIAQGTVLAPGIWWAKFSPDKRNINQITAQGETDMGGGAVFYDAQVWIERVAPPPQPAPATHEEIAANGTARQATNHATNGTTNGATKTAANRTT